MSEPAFQDISPTLFEKKVASFNAFGQHYLIHHVLKQQHPNIFQQLHGLSDPQYSSMVSPTLSLTPKERISVIRKIDAISAPFTYDSSLLNWLKFTLNKQIKNNPTFVLRSIFKDGSIQVGLGDYESTLSTSDKHYFNLVRCCPTEHSDKALEHYAQQPTVKAWAEQLERVALHHDFSHYCASMGCSVVTIINTQPEGYQCVMQQNAPSKASGVRDYHVAPSFMFQPTGAEPNDYIDELDVSLGVIREYGEEVLGLDELENAGSVRDLKKQINDSALLNKLQQDIESGASTLISTGLVLDIFRLRPELTYLLVIDDPQYAETLKGNWESEKLVRIDASSSAAINAFLYENKARIAPPAIAALIKAQAPFSALTPNE